MNEPIEKHVVAVQGRDGILKVDPSFVDPPVPGEQVSTKIQVVEIGHETGLKKEQVG